MLQNRTARIKQCSEMINNEHGINKFIIGRVVSRIFQKGGGGEGGITLCHIQGNYIVHCRRLVLKNGLCNFLALEKICGMLTLRIRAFLPPEVQGSYVVYLKKLQYLTKGGGAGGGGGGVMGTPGPSPGHN